MIQEENSYRFPVFILCMAGLVGYAVLSLFFCWERVLNTDNTHFFFSIVNSENFFIAEKRYGVVFSQIPLLFAIKAGISLFNLVWIYSFSFPLLYLICALISFWYFKSTEAVIVLTLGLLTGVAQSFFHPVTETHQAIAFSSLFYACISSSINGTYKSILGTLLLILAVSTHPAALFMTGFAVLWQLSSGHYKEPALWSMLIILLTLAVIKPLINKDNYDAEQYSRMISSFKNWRTISSWKSLSFLSDHYVLYSIPVVIFLLSSSLIFISKNFFRLFIYLSVPLFFVLVSAATFSGGDSQMMMEKAYMPAWFMILFGFPSIFSSFSFNLFAGYSLLISFILFALITIFKTGRQDFSPRINALTLFISSQEKSPDRKVILHDSHLPDFWKFNWWATSADVLIMSQATTGNGITLYLAKPDENIEFGNMDTSFLYTSWYLTRSIRELNPSYFSLPNQPYRIINYNQ